MEERLEADLVLLPGQLFAERYRIAMPIGKGGMGRVYLAEDIRLGGKNVALKLTRPLPEERRSFLPEAQLLSVLDHPNLPAIVDYFPPNAEGVACIVMDYIAGDTIAERFERYGYRLSFAFVLGVLADLCEVLIYLHSQTPPIVFRDLKPANVLLDRHNKAILVDFGIARRYREHMSNDTLQLGTPGFAAPEQLRGEQSDSRTDIYGLGALAYFLLSGGKFAIRHQGEFKRVVQDDVPAAFILLLDRLLASQPEGRPQSALELLDEIKAIQRDAEEGTRARRSSHEFIHDRYAPQDYGNNGKVTVIAVASAYAGAGATFASVALSSALARKGIPHSMVECPGSDSELYAYLNGERRMPRGAVFAHGNGQQAAVPAWRSGKATYYPLNPNEANNPLPDSAFAKWLRKLGSPIVLLDMSSRWDQPLLKEWLIRSVDQLAMVADCYPAKWSARRQASCMELLSQTKQRRIRNVWIANRDQPFPDRKQWLNLFPVKPDILLPDLTGSATLNALWRGEGVPSDSRAANKIDEACSEWVESISLR
ncbi:serine/threonine protein kinase [Cohnella herbarum]|uniref:Serine/threonine protein kinase n=1 Tax=Cohnella herbarum TaxID=2728023 RepID=A0A7Z2VGE4_9BACL|nr:serine/threonine-protein kinase [Cohnella herbarum]QJD82557.1 serine/threonine protein kinase [Cohnella herbarum]